MTGDGNAAFPGAHAFAHAEEAQRALGNELVIGNPDTVVMDGEAKRVVR